MTCQTGTFASSNLTRVAYAAETVYGVPEAPLDMKLLRFVSASPVADKQTAISDEIRPDRMVAGISEIGFASGGGLGIEMSLGGTYDDWVEVAMSGQWSTAITFTGALQVVAATATVSDPGTGGTAFANAEAGQWVYLTGFVNAENNGWWKIVTVTDADNIIVLDDNTALVDETGPITSTAAGKTALNGVCENSFTVELGFTDILAFILFAGQRPNWTLSVAASALVTGSFDITGSSVDAAATEFGDSYAASTTTLPLNATANVGQITKNGVPMTTAIQSLDFTVDNSYRTDNAVGEKYPANVAYGRQIVSGTLTAYFQNLELYTEMLAHDAVSLSFSLTDGDGNSMHIELPEIYFLSSDPAPGGTDQTIVENIEWQATVNNAGTYQMRVDMALAA